MSYKRFFISDTHFDHKGIITFKDSDGKPVRPFTSVEEMNEAMIENWNQVVRPCDKVYHLGDVCFSAKSLSILNKLNGTKSLIRGNHDLKITSRYSAYFKEIYGVKAFKYEDIEFICSHIPIHPDCVGRWGFNVHGHLHTNVIADPRYINVSVEQINYTPIEIEELYQIIKQRREEC